MNVLINISLIRCHKHHVFVIKISVAKFPFDKGYGRRIGKLLYRAANPRSNHSDSGGCFHDELKLSGRYFASAYN